MAEAIAKSSVPFLDLLHAEQRGWTVSRRGEWLDLKPSYSGAATALFGSTSRALRGTASTSIDEHGILSVEFEMRQGGRSIGPSSDDLAMILGGDATRRGSARRIPLGVQQTRCTGFKVETADGRYEITAGFDHDLKLETGGTSLRFRPLRSRFTRRSRAKPVYWVMSLVNCMCSFRPQVDDRLRHVLRVLPPKRASRLAAALVGVRTRHGALLSNYVSFQHAGCQGFIEPIERFPQLRDSLVRGEVRSAITAVMIGEIPPAHRSNRNVNEWIPYDLLLLLSLAAGVEVRAAWVELRSARGKLVSRHHSQGYPCYSKGYSFIDESIHGGTGELLTKWPRAELVDSEAALAAMRNIVESGQYATRTLDDGMRHMGVAIELLATAVGVRGMSRIAPKSQRQALARIVDGASGEIRELAAEARAAGNRGLQRALESVARDVKNCRGPRQSFGELVSALCGHAGLCDPSIVEAEYQQDPWDTSQKTWEGLLTRCRGRATHGGLIDADDPRQIDILYHVTNHLRDLAVRVLLKQIGYAGKYQPSVIVGSTRASVDWVSSETLALRLGYDVQALRPPN